MNREDTYNVNENIRADELRVVSETGENLGVFSKPDALKLARERGLDLIEIASRTQPPVARIISFDKFRYQEEKEARKKNREQKGRDMKQVRITPRAAKNDLETKAKRARAFLDDGHRVEVSIFLRGREKANKGFAKEKLQEFLAMLGEAYITVAPPKDSGRGFTTQVVKK